MRDNDSTPVLTTKDLDIGRAVLRALSTQTLERMQNALTTAIRVGEAGAATWAAADAIRSELERRSSEEADGTTGL